MFETFLQMQIIHQKTFNKVASFDGHLHCWSPLHSTALENNQKTTDDNKIKSFRPCRCTDVHLSLHYHPLLNILCTINT